jgi:hypothetical protein
MTVFVPSTTVTVERGETLDEFGDSVDLTTQVATGVPVFVTEGSLVSSSNRTKQVTYRPADQRETVIENYTLRFRPTADIQEQDRLVDERHEGITYLVVDVFNPQSAFGMADVRALAIRVGAHSQSVND